jgi:acetyl esterase/lipase
MTVSLDVKPLLDPEVAQALSFLDLELGSLSSENLPRIRQRMAALPPVPLSNEVTCDEHFISERDHVSVRVHRKKNAPGKLPCIYWMHGGGLVLGSSIGDDPRFDRWCPRLNCVGVSVDYALAPESKYPGPLEDCYAGLRWVHDNAETLGIDTQRIGIGGSSAGAGLAAGLALLARDRAELAIAFQALFYPMLDHRQGTTSSQWQDPVWPPQANRFGWDSYLGNLTADVVPGYAAAARADDLAGLPPTFICVGALDCFSDEDIEYATRLRHAGVPTELHVYPGAPHGFDAFAPNTTVARQANQDMENWLTSRMRSPGR